MKLFTGLLHERNALLLSFIIHSCSCHLSQKLQTLGVRCCGHLIDLHKTRNNEMKMKLPVYSIRCYCQNIKLNWYFTNQELFFLIIWFKYDRDGSMFFLLDYRQCSTGSGELLCYKQVWDWHPLLSHLSLLDNVVRVTAGEAGTLQKVHDVIFTATRTASEIHVKGRYSFLCNIDLFTSSKTVNPHSTYVTIFLSKKYWSFFAPMTRRRETSSLSIWWETN